MSTLEVLIEEDLLLTYTSYFFNKIHLYKNNLVDIYILILFFH